MLRPTLALGAFVTVTALGALGPFGAAAYAQEGGGNNWGAVGGAAAPADQPAAEAKAGASGPEAASGGAAGPKASGGAAGPKAEGKAAGPRAEAAGLKAAGADGKAAGVGADGKVAGAGADAKTAGADTKTAGGGAKGEAPAAAANNFVRGRYLFEAGVGTQGRSFYYLHAPSSVGQSGDNVRPYDALVTPHFFAHVDAFPFAGAGDSFANNVGLTATLGGSVGQTSTLAGGGRDAVQTGVRTTFVHLRVGPKLRFALGSGDKAPMLTGEVAYSRWAFTFDDAAGSSPSFVYQSIRPGVGLRLPAGPVALLVEGGYHVVTDAGQLGARFPNASVHGFDAQLGFALPISRVFEGRFSINYNRYRGNLKAELDPASPAGYTGYVAAGSVDQFFGAHLGVAVAP